jgi:serine/threonine protein kinase
MSKRKIDEVSTSDEGSTIDEVSTSVTLKGYGGFGCVISPAIECNPFFPTQVLTDGGVITDVEPIYTKGIDIATIDRKYTKDTLQGHVFKILLDDYANQEFTKSQDILKSSSGTGAILSKYCILKSTKGKYNNFHESFKPIMKLCSRVCDEKCVAGLSKAWTDTKEISFDSNSLMMIIYEDGGVSLDDYLDALLKSGEKYEPTSIEKFLNSLKNLFEGLQAFRLNRIMHGDIRPENIVYNEKSGVAKFIDFGSATSETKLLHATQNSNSRFDLIIQAEIRHNSPYAATLADIQNLFRTIDGREARKIGFVKKIIDKSDFYMLCFELRKYLKDYYSLLLKDKVRYAIYITFISRFFDLLSRGCNSYSKPDGSPEILTLETLIEEYDALLTALHPTTGGYNKKSNKRKTKRKRKSKRKSNKRKTKRKRKSKRKINNK